MNAGIQGLAADIFKLALVRLDRGLEDRGGTSRLILQVHDEVVLEVPPADEAEITAVVLDAMSGAFDLAVPLEVNLAFGDTWADVCEFTLEPMPEIDRELGNWFTSTHPRSHFRDRLMAARATEDGRVTLLDRVLTRRRTGGEAETHTSATPAELIALLASEFGLELPPDTRFPHLADLW